MLITSEYFFHPNLSNYFKQLLQSRSESLSDSGKHSVQCAINIQGLFLKVLFIIDILCAEVFSTGYIV